MKMEIFTAKMPGEDWAMASKSIKSSLANHPRLVTISSSISGTMAYPPPMVNAPILKKMEKAWRYRFIMK